MTIPIPRRCPSAPPAAGITVAGVGATGDDAFRLADRLRPDVTLVDIDLGARMASPSAGGWRNSKVRRREAHPDLTHAADEFADLIEASPAIGFVPKSALSAQAVYALTDADRERHP